ncbi:hypothetical protein WA026_001414 [Henosepilachna vigintioctopunctata]|uniref:PHD-type domain-containing protein n=1 Tax=Henosepilachna vigintioctopunctata TaxID=420089 RepID=A0AAW1UL34_9CUCU
MHCVVCDKTIGKSGYKIQCRKCDGWAHLNCTNIAKDDIHDKKKIDWHCKQCRDSSTSALEEELEEEASLREKLDRCIKRRQRQIYEHSPSTQDMFKKLLKKIEGLEEAMSFNNEMVEGMRSSLDELRKENKSIKTKYEKLKIEVQELRQEVTVLKEKNAATDIEADLNSRKRNIIISGVIDKNEIVKVLENLGINDAGIKRRPKEMLFRIERVGKFELGKHEFGGTERNIYLSEDLPKTIQELLRKAKELRESGYKYVWSKEGKVFCRKADFAKVLRIKNIQQVEELQQQSVNT